MPDCGGGSARRPHISKELREAQPIRCCGEHFRRRCPTAFGLRQRREHRWHRRNGTGGGTAGDVAAKVDCGGKKSLKASGASSQANAVTRFVTAYETACSGYTLNYTSSGSGAGVSEFIGGQTDFAGSDSPLSAEKGEVDKAKQRCGGADAWNLPTVFGPIAITYNLPGVDGARSRRAHPRQDLQRRRHDVERAGDRGAQLGQDATRRQDQRDLPQRRVRHHGQLPGYLDAASDGAWGKGAGKTFNGGVGEGAKGNEGTSAAIKNTPGSITYNEWSYAKKQGLQVADIVTSAGPDPVKLTAESAGKSIDTRQDQG